MRRAEEEGQKEAQTAHRVLEGHVPGEAERNHKAPSGASGLRFWGGAFGHTHNLARSSHNANDHD